MRQRMRKTVPLSFEVSPAMRDELYAVAQADAGRSVASIIRLALDEFLSRRQPEPAIRQTRNRSRIDRADEVAA